MTRMIMRLQSIVSLSIVLVLSSVGWAQAIDDLPVGASWKYSYEDTYEGITLSGTYEYSYTGMSQCMIGATDREALEFIGTLNATLSGTYESYGVSGSLDAAIREYYEIDDGDLIGYVTDMNFVERWTYSLEVYEWNLVEHNETILLPPGGSGVEPSVLEPGVTWEWNYSMISNTSGYRNGEAFAESNEYLMAVTVLYVADESLTVPAGTFDCSVFERQYSDGTVSKIWFCEDIDGNVKMIDRYASGEIATYLLTAYSLDERDDSISFELTYFGIGFYIFIGATVVLAIFARYLRKAPPLS